MLSNLRRPENAQLIATVSKTSIAPNALELFRNYLSKRSTEFLADVEDRLIEATSDKKTGNTISVTVFSNESLVSRTDDKSATKKRKNFRRNS